MTGAASAVLASPALAGNGGVSYTPTPRVVRVACVKQCASHGRARQGGRIRIIGSSLSAVSKVVFMGGPGKSDDVTVKVRARSDRSLTVKVPLDAASGRLAVVAGDAVTTSARSTPVSILPPLPPPPSTGRLTPVPGPSDPGAPKLETATSSNRAFAGSRAGITFSYRITAPSPVPVEVDLLRENDGVVIQTWQAPDVRPDTVNKITWDGVSQGQLQPDGRYAWRLTATSANGAKARSALVQDDTRDAFDLHDHIFPVRGRHTFGDGFGAPRSGHVHMGQDIMTSCGKKIAAVEAGTVLYRKWQSAAGNYLVLHGDETGQDYFYAHMRSPSPYQAGDHLTTGEIIGNVGETGDATACHLHFEIWTAPGWYNGGHAFDPLPQLEEWDAYS